MAKNTIVTMEKRFKLWGGGSPEDGASIAGGGDDDDDGTWACRSIVVPAEALSIAETLEMGGTQNKRKPTLRSRNPGSINRQRYRQMDGTDSCRKTNATTQLRRRIPCIYFKPASRSITSRLNLISIVHLCGKFSSPVACAVTLSVKNKLESNTASTIPARNALQFNCDIFAGTEIYLVIIGVLSCTMSTVNPLVAKEGDIHRRVPLTSLTNPPFYRKGSSIPSNV
jgi:hypothetical protein